MMNSIFNEDDRNFKLTTFRRISYLLSKIDIFNDFAFTDISGFNRHLNPSCIEVVFHDVETGHVFVRINLDSLEIDILHDLEKYRELIRSIIYDKLDFTQIERELKIIQVLE